jgi:hypothetical protein
VFENATVETVSAICLTVYKTVVTSSISGEFQSSGEVPGVPRSKASPWRAMKPERHTLIPWSERSSFENGALGVGPGVPAQC